MKSALYLAMAVALVAVFTTDVSAQSYNQSYQFGVGLNYGGGFPYPNLDDCNRGGFFGNRIGVLRRQESPPYFAQFPPVYYSGIVRRPYGISPYAAPPGIVPTPFTYCPPSV